MDKSLPQSGLLFFVLVLCALPIHAQPTTDDTFSPADVWSVQGYQSDASPGQGGSGHAGLNYWQNQVQYQIEAQLDTSAKTVQGTVEIDYTNNSPDPLSSIWLLRAPSVSAHQDSTLQVRVNDVTVRQADQSLSATTYPADSRLQIRLSEPLDPTGGTLTLALKFKVSLPQRKNPGAHSRPKRPDLSRRTLVSPRGRVQPLPRMGDAFDPHLRRIRLLRVRPYRPRVVYRRRLRRPLESGRRPHRRPTTAPEPGTRQFPQGRHHCPGQSRLSRYPSRTVRRPNLGVRHERRSDGRLGGLSLVYLERCSV